VGTQHYVRLPVEEFINEAVRIVEEAQRRGWYLGLSVL